MQMAGGRPSTYSTDITDEICERIAIGQSLRTITSDERMPAMSTIFKWIREHEEFSKHYAIAKAEQAEALTEEMLDIVDSAANPLLVEGVPLVIDGKPVMIVDAPSVNHARLKVDTRKWLASKLKPKKYGEKLELSGDENNPLTVSVIERVIVK